jgi:RNA polymerase sigma-70 factor, ECF subfamily
MSGSGESAVPLRGSDPRAVFGRFSRRLIGLARTRLDKRTRAKVDPEDVVQSAFRSFFIRDAAGQFTAENWDDLWRILVVITVRKCNRQIVGLRRARRDIRREVAAAGSDEDDLQMPEAVDREPTPDEVVSLIETVERLLGRADEVEREILLMRLDGYAPPEIAREVSRRVSPISERKVYRVIAQARTRLAEELGG